MTTASVPFIDMLYEAQERNGTSLCVGLDPNPVQFPYGWPTTPEGIYTFCSRIVEVTAHVVIAFKPQIAYFAANRAEAQLEQLIARIRQVAPYVPVILDAKRGDIGPTAEQYAKEAFERYGADAVTLSPYLGLDSIEPYMRYEGKGVFLLCRTSNPGSNDIQGLPVGDVAGDYHVYEKVATMANTLWNINGQLGLVVGATYPEELKRVRDIAPKLPLLVPGIGAQGGDEAAVIRNAWRPDALVVVNSSRAVLYPKGKNSTFDDCFRAAITTCVNLELEKQRMLCT